MRTLEQRVETIVVGGGQAGLSVGYQLARRGLPFVILDAGDRVGDSWRGRWDSLRLFTPARYDGLAGMRFPAPRHSYPTKDAMADYLESYATRFDLPVRLGVRVDRVARNGTGFVVTAGERRLLADNVVVAVGSWQRPRVPDFAAGLDPAVVQLHSAAYRNADQLQDGHVLVVGAGNSGAEVALDVARSGRQVWLSGRGRRAHPNPHRVVRRTLRSPAHPARRLPPPADDADADGPPQAAGGLRAWPSARADQAGGPRRCRHRTRPTRHRRPRRAPELEDGRVLDVANVLWCTGFGPASTGSTSPASPTTTR